VEEAGVEGSLPHAMEHFGIQQGAAYRLGTVENG